MNLCYCSRVCICIFGVHVSWLEGMSSKRQWRNWRANAIVLASNFPSVSKHLITFYTPLLWVLSLDLTFRRLLMRKLGTCFHKALGIHKSRLSMYKISPKHPSSAPYTSCVPWQLSCENNRRCLDKARCGILSLYSANLSSVSTIDSRHRSRA